MLMAYIPPTKWWRREYAWHFKIVLWPKWLARKLCDHSAMKSWRDVALEPTDNTMYCCPDCGQLVNIEGMEII